MKHYKTMMVLLVALVFCGACSGFAADSAGLGIVTGQATFTMQQGW